MLADGLTMMYGLDRPPTPATTRYGEAQLDRVFSELSAASFGGGLYRVHTPDGAEEWTSRAEELFPELTDRMLVFGYDWLGRQFAADAHRMEGDHYQVLILDPGTGEALEVPTTVADLHTEELVQYGDAALAVDFYADWREASGDEDFLAEGECVGYQVPLFLGGDDDVSNLARIDMEMYWTIVIQLRSGERELPPGATIQDVITGA